MTGVRDRPGASYGTGYATQTRTTDDAAAITVLFLAARRRAMPYLPDLHTEAETRWWIKNVVIARGGTMVAADDRHIVGFGTMRGDHLAHLCVAPDVQGRGVGRGLLAAATDASTGQLTLNVLQRNTRARAFYEGHGFKLLVLRGSSANEEQEPDAVYAWRRTSDRSRASAREPDSGNGGRPSSSPSNRPCHPG